MSEALGTNLETGDSAEITVQRRRKSAAPDTVAIIIEENEDIPPTGLFVGVNGRGYLIKPGEKVNVPRAVVEVLEHAMMSVPQVDPQTRQVVGYRDRLRYPYRLIA